jgi:hypothetical protein
MSFIYFTRKPEDIAEYKKFMSAKKGLMDDYNSKRSDYDKTLEKYSGLLKKLDSFPKDSIEHNNLVVELTGLQTILKDDKPKVNDVVVPSSTAVDDVLPNYDNKEEEIEPKKKPKKAYKPRAKKVPTILINDDEE